MDKLDKKDIDKKDILLQWFSEMNIGNPAEICIETYRKPSGFVMYVDLPCQERYFRVHSTAQTVEISYHDEELECTTNRRADGKQRSAICEWANPKLFEELAQEIIRCSTYFPKKLKSIIGV